MNLICLLRHHFWEKSFRVIGEVGGGRKAIDYRRRCARCKTMQQFNPGRGWHKIPGGQGMWPDKESERE